MNASYHAVSHLGRMSVDHLINRKPSTLRQHLDFYRRAAENKMRNALHSDLEAMWLRGWEQWKEITEQIRVLDGVS